MRASHEGPSRIRTFHLALHPAQGIRELGQHRPQSVNVGPDIDRSLIGLFHGENLGKQLVRVTSDESGEQ